MYIYVPWQKNSVFKFYSWQYVYTREMREMEINSIPSVVVLAESNSLSKIPEKSGVVRVKEFHQSLVIQSDGKVGTKGTEQVAYVSK